MNSCGADVSRVGGSYGLVMTTSTMPKESLLVFISLLEYFSIFLKVGKAQYLVVLSYEKKLN